MTDAAASPFVDLSHVIRDGEVTYPGLPAPEISAHLTREQSRASYAPGTEFEIGAIRMVGNTGTYLDTAYHRYADGPDLAALPLEAVVGLRAELFRLVDTGERGIGAAAFEDRDVFAAAVLLHTGWDRHFGTEQYGEPAPFLSEEGAAYLVEQGVALVGIDSVNIDDTSPDAAGARPAHSLLLGAGIPVVEHLTNLAQVPLSGATFTAVPPKVAGFGTFPVRAFAVLP
jgi:arylformamidase